jgi:hypothetical protein
MPPLGETIHVAHRDGSFVHGELVLTPVMEFEYPGDAPHPSETEIPNVQLSIATRFASQK